MQTSSIFIRHLTVVDCAIVDPEGRIMGDSFHPSFVITGPVSSDEQVVIDFGTCKKRIKAIIDDYADGFDHKLWVIEGYSQYNRFDVHDDRTVLETNQAIVDAPNHTFKFIKNESNEFGIMAIARVAFENELTQKLQAEFPGVIVSCHNNSQVFSEGSFVRFQYAHFLPNSTSLPCKRCWHGHGSFIESDCDRNTLEAIGRDIRKVLFVNSSHIVNENEEWISLEVTNNLGDSYATAVSTSHDIVQLEIDTTIENIAEWVSATYGDIIKNAGGSYVAVSEGLSKGAVVNL